MPSASPNVSCIDCHPRCVALLSPSRGELFRPSLGLGGWKSGLEGFHHGTEHATNAGARLAYWVERCFVDVIKAMSDEELGFHLSKRSQTDTEEAQVIAGRGSCVSFRDVGW